MIQQEQLERFDNYHFGRLPEEEMQAFEEALSRDAQLRDDYDTYSLMVASISSSALLDEIRHHHADTSNDAPASTPKSSFGAAKPFWWIAAGALLIIMLYVGYERLLKTTNLHSTHYIAYYEPDPGLPTTMGAHEDFEFARGMVAYKSGQYDKAISHWKPLTTQEALEAKYHYYLAMAYQADGRLVDAQTLLDQLLDTEDIGVYQRKSHWYRSLIAIEQGDVPLAQELLKRSNHPLADGLLDDLKNEK